MSHSNKLPTIFFVIFVSIILSSCSIQDKINIGKPENFQLISDINDTFIVCISLPVENTSRYNIILKKSHFDILADSVPLGKAIQLHPVTFEKNKKQLYAVTFQAFLSGDADLLSLGLKSLFGKQPDLRLNGKAIAKYGLFRRSFNIDMPINENWKQIRRWLQ